MGYGRKIDKNEDKKIIINHYNVKFDFSVIEFQNIHFSKY